MNTPTPKQKQDAIDTLDTARTMLEEYVDLLTMLAEYGELLDALTDHGSGCNPSKLADVVRAQKDTEDLFYAMREAQ